MNDLIRYFLPFVELTAAAFCISCAVAHPCPFTWALAVWLFGAAMLLGMFMSK
jgi:hypothetical protein